MSLVLIKRKFELFMICHSAVGLKPALKGRVDRTCLAPLSLITLIATLLERSVAMALNFVSKCPHRVLLTTLSKYKSTPLHTPISEWMNSNSTNAAWSILLCKKKKVFFMIVVSVYFGKYDLKLLNPQFKIFNFLFKLSPLFLLSLTLRMRAKIIIIFKELMHYY